MDDHAFCFILLYLIWLQVGSVNCGGNGKKDISQMHEYNPTRDYADNCTGNGRNN